MANVQQLTPAQQQAMQNQQALQMNMQARAMVLANAFPVSQLVDSQTFNPNSRNTFDINGTNVGILKGFTVEVKATIKNNGQAEMGKTALNVANLIKNISYYDPNNQRRIETTGWHIAMINTIKGNQPFAGTINNTSPIQFGNNYNVIKATGQIAAGAETQVVIHYWIPLAYSESDLTGAVFLNVAQSKQRLRLEFANDASAFVSDTGDKLNAVYSAPDIDGEITGMEYKVYQHYLDQLPMANGQFILPALDLSTIYLLETSTVSGLTNNSDFPVQYGNLYRYLSTLVVFDNGGQFNAGTDVNYLALRTANFSDYRKATPETWNLETRKLIGTDLPNGFYLAETRQKPIYTLQTGNQTIVVNPKNVQANARLILGYESFVTATNLVNIGTMATT